MSAVPKADLKRGDRGWSLIRLYRQIIAKNDGCNLVVGKDFVTWYGQDLKTVTLHKFSWDKEKTL